MPARRAPQSLLAGNVSVSLGADGEPQAALAHPSGGSCVVAVRGARVLSWRAGEAERLSPEEGGAFGPRHLACVPGAAWDIEPPQVGLTEEGAVAFSVFAEVPPGEAGAEPGAPLAARCTFSLWPSRLSV